MRGNEEICEGGQTIKHIRWKGGERVRTKFDGGRKMKGKIEDEVMEEEKKTREKAKVVESIESPRFN